MKNSEGIEQKLLERIKLCKLSPPQRRSLPLNAIGRTQSLFKRKSLFLPTSGLDWEELID